MPQIKSNFILRSKAPNFERDSYESLLAMRAVNPGHMDEGHISYCKETGKHYVFNMDNGFDKETGYFTLLTTGVSDNLPTGTIEYIIYDTLVDMRDDMETDLQLGQTVYCRETKSLYYYAFDPKYDAQDPNQIPFDEITGYFRGFEASLSDDDIKEIEDAIAEMESNYIKLEDSINNLEETVKGYDDDIKEMESSISKVEETVKGYDDDIKEIMNHLWPVQISIDGTSGIYRQGDPVKNAYVSWGVSKKGEKLTPTSVIVNGLNVEDLSAGKYVFTNDITSPNTSLYSSTATNTISVNYNDIISNSEKSLEFIYPKYHGYVVGSSAEINSIEITGENVWNYIKSGEILSRSISQNINIPSNTGMGRWLYVYPKDLGKINSIVDGNGFNQMNGVTVSEIDIIDPITSKTIKYYVYIQTTSSDISDSIIKIN